MNVVHVITGAVRSNFGASALAGSVLPAGSRCLLSIRPCVCPRVWASRPRRYAALQPYINARATSSQRDGAMDAADYARTVAEAALSAAPAWEVVAGGSARYYHMVGRYMPMSMWAKQISRKLGLHLLGSTEPPSGSPFAWVALTVVVTGIVVAALRAAGVSVSVLKGTTTFRQVGRR